MFLYRRGNHHLQLTTSLPRNKALRYDGVIRVLMRKRKVYESPCGVPSVNHAASAGKTLNSNPLFDTECQTDVKRILRGDDGSEREKRSETDKPGEKKKALSLSNELMHTPVSTMFKHEPTHFCEKTSRLGSNEHVESIKNELLNIVR